ncbi:MAG: hypothetical protein R2834_03735 [Rhodothermales bacterium]
MKRMTLIGLLLIVLGGIGLVYGGVSYMTEEKVLDLGKLEIEAQKEHTIPLPPVAGAILLATGVVVILAGSRKA